MRKYFTVVIVLILLLIMVGCSNNTAPQLAVPVSVTKVTDGDTIHVTLNGKDESVRLIGVNSPELSHPQQKIEEQPYGTQALEYTRKALLNQQVYLELDVGERDRYGRVLAYVWLKQPKDSSVKEVRGKMFNARLLLDGYAQVMTVSPNVKYAGVFKSLEGEARANKKGLWSTAGEKPNDRYK